MLHIMPYENRSYVVFDLFRNMEKEILRTDLGKFNVDVRDNGDSFLVEADLPGVKREDIELDINNDYLTLKATRNQSREVENKSYILNERSYGSYERSFSVKNVDSDAITADYKDGVLSIVMPKRKENVTSKKIAIN